ncbi:MAG: hypothetical protein KDD11_01370 [Acidobacteria bacterium]|nr:hypothetical protein [Acidobacteriota bacterium]
MTDATVETTLQLPVGSSLERIAELASPILRTCHLGNNTSNVWGWLAMAGNTRLVLYDHTLYGLDTNCIPWTVLGDGGRVDACFSHTGEPCPDQVGLHVNDHLRSLGRRHSSHLCYGIPAVHEGRDLASHHLALAERLSESCNGSQPSFDSQEFEVDQALFGEVLRCFAHRRRLDRIFDRWVRETRKGFVVQRRLSAIRHDGGDVEIEDIDGVRVFRGSTDELIRVFFEGVGRVARRLRSGELRGPFDYPWVTLPFGYLSAAVSESAKEPRRRTFWHAGGSSSSYYFNEPGMRASFDELTGLLQAEGFLPSRFRFRIVPTFGCQLFATTTDSLERLVALVETWHGHLRHHRPRIAAYLGALSTTVRPFDVAQEATESLPPRLRRTLVAELDAFNEIDRNRLPVAHVVDPPHPHYNKYGIAQHHLLGCRPRFPDRLQGLCWGELELLVRILAHLKRADPG